MRASPVPISLLPAHRPGRVLTAWSISGWASPAGSRHRSHSSTSSHARLRNATARRPCVRVSCCCTRLVQIPLDLRRGKARGGQAVLQPRPKQAGQAGPLPGAGCIAHKGIPAEAVHRQQAAAAPQPDHMQVPAKAQVGLCAVKRGLHRRCRCSGMVRPSSISCPRAG